MGIRRPVGVVGAIAPWNAALILSARSIAAPLALGNTVVLKPSEWSPYVRRPALGRDLRRGGPPGGRAEHRHARARARPARSATSSSRTRPCGGINFTGSTSTGRRLAEAAGRNLKRVLLELGGSNPLIVLADADLEYAVKASAFGAFLHQGQICMSARRIIVERPIADEFVARLAAKTAGLKAGDPKEMDTIIGPLITEEALATVQNGSTTRSPRERRCSQAARRSGRASRRRSSRDVPGGLGARRARDVRPGGGDRDRRQPGRGGRARERDELRALVGDHHVDPDRGFALAQQIEAGIVHVNDQPVGDEPQMPFGGVKDSGFGRFGGQAVVDEFTELRWITVQSGTHPFPF